MCDCGNVEEIHTRLAVIHTYVCTVDAKLKFPFRIRRTLVVLSVTVITEDTLEPCHLRLVLSTSPTILFFV